VKTDEQFLKDRVELFETEGWSDLMEELKNIESSVRDVDTMKNEQDLWHAKGQLQLLGYVISLESATKITMEQSETTPL
jgi:hypothetical protein